MLSKDSEQPHPVQSVLKESLLSVGIVSIWCRILIDMNVLSVQSISRSGNRKEVIFNLHAGIVYCPIGKFWHLILVPMFIHARKLYFCIES